MVGPRPERPEFVPVLAEQIPGYLERLAVPPGVTGLAQVNLPPDVDLDSVRRKLVLDLEYCDEASPLLDARLLLCTLLRAVGWKWAGVRRVLGEPVVRIGIAAEDELQPVPLKTVAHRAVDDVDRRPRANRYAVRLVHDLVLAPMSFA